MDLVGLVAGSGWASGVNLYAVVALLGILGRTTPAGGVPEPLTSTPVIVVAAAAYLVEFVVDKVPYLDNTWDAVHTVVRPLGAAVLGVLLTTEEPALRQVVSAGGAGTLALAAHAAKATLRAAINTSPEPFSNVLVSVAEDGLAAGVVWFALQHPAVALALVAVLLVVGAAATVLLWRTARAGVRRLRGHRERAG